MPPCPTLRFQVAAHLPMLADGADAQMRLRHARSDSIPHNFFSPRPLGLGPATVWTIAAFVALGPFTLTMYQPSLPLIAQGLATPPGRVQLTLTAYLVAFAVGQLVYGPVSDRFGRRASLLVGLLIYTVGTVACAVAYSVEMLIAARLVQGLGACAGTALGRAMIRDLYGAQGSRKALASVASALSIAPAVAPVFGGYVAGSLGWRAIFAALALAGFAMLIFVALRIPETNQSRSTKGGVRAMAIGYLRLLQDPAYLAYLTIASVAVGGSYAFQAVSPFIFLEMLGLGPELFGWLILTLTGAYFCGTVLASRLTDRFGLDRMIVFGGGLLVLGSGTLLVLSIIGHLSIASTWGPHLVWLLGMGIILPNSMAGALAAYPHAAGAASALQGFAMMGTGAAASMLLAHLNAGTARPLGLTMLALAVVGLTVFASLRRGKSPA